MKTQHTPGPWFVSTPTYRTLYVEARVRNGMLQEVAVCGPTAYPAQQAANARLIAAAPELLEALEELCACPQGVDEATVPKAGVEANPTQVVMNMSVGLVRLRKAQAAIAKATGEST